jgi:hypothetical protein
MARSVIIFQTRVSLSQFMAHRASMLAVKICPGRLVRLLRIWLRQIDLLSRTKDGALPGRDIG